jgi:hypothetical protein
MNQVIILRKSSKLNPKGSKATFEFEGYSEAMDKYMEVCMDEARHQAFLSSQNISATIMLVDLDNDQVRFQMTIKTAKRKPAPVPSQSY